MMFKKLTVLTTAVFLSTTGLISGCGNDQQESAKETAELPAEVSTLESVETMETADTATQPAEEYADTAETAADQTVAGTIEPEVETVASEKLESAVETARTLTDTATAGIEKAVAEIKTATVEPERVVETTPEMARRIQQALADAGYNPGDIDGIVGSKTMKAVKSYQQDKGLTVGKISNKTLDSLGVSY